MIKALKNRFKKLNKKTIIVFFIFFVLFLLIMKGNTGNISSGEEIQDYFAEERVTHRAGKTLITHRNLSQYLSLISIVEYKKISLDESLLAKTGTDVGYINGKVFSWFPLGLQIISIPFYVIGKMLNLNLFISHFSVMMFAFLNLILLFNISTKIFKTTKKTGHLISFIYGFSSISLVFTAVFVPHQISTFLLLSCFYLAWKFTKESSVKKKILYMSLVWILWSTSSFFDYPNWIIIAPVFFYLFFKILRQDNIKKNLIIFFITSIIGILGLSSQALYNHIVFGKWTQMSNTLSQNPELFKQHGFVSKKEMKYVGERQNMLLRIFKTKRIKNGTEVLLISKSRGLFVFSPIFIVSIFGYFWFIRKKSHERMFLLYAPIFTILLYSSFSDPWGGISFGARYLIPVMAIYSIIAGMIYEKTKNNIFKIGIIGLIVYSIIQALAGVMTSIAIPKDYESVIFGVKKADLLASDTTGNFIYRVFLEGKISLVAWYLIVLTLFIITLGYILKDNIKKDKISN